ncbi:MAG TPA: FecR domain-containing protein [Anaerohalosphaeraceae bacterium]|nr:FecR domain-containing protein [Anaerohalosphaeraceae bacterium]HOL88595.1 FecR domain-containing protein [Anaerohalosphaeraceae bacterium]HPP56258.1 FecR domain-containing protein [Anaerohalosphaeraceae bacterium]
MNERDLMRISELLIYCCNGIAGQEEIRELETLLRQDKEALDYCVDVLMDLNYFHCLAQTPLSHPEEVPSFETDESVFMCELDPQEQWALLGDFAEYEKQAAALKIETAPKPPESPSREKTAVQGRPTKSRKYSLAAAVLSAAALLIIILSAHLAPAPAEEVASVLDSIDAEWSSELPFQAGTRLDCSSKPIRLTRGWVKLRTDEQVELVLEAPTEFRFRSSSEIILNYGKLFARVSELGSGFSVTTPNSKVVDLGTEFGVVCHIDGNTDVHLYKGRANLFAGEKHKRKVSQMLTAGSARRIASEGSVIREIELDERALVRQIDSKSRFIWRGQKTLQLSDLILGGNGFGSAVLRQIEFDPQTGKIVSNPVAGYRRGTGTFVPIPENPYLDGLFVPGSGAGDVVISSKGHTFRECPQTSGLYYSNIICFKDWTFYEPLQGIFEKTVKQFEESGLLYFHSNMGLTVDLEAVRRIVPGLRLDSFSAYAGMIRMGQNPPDYAEADIWVLVDGQLRCSRKQLRAGEGFEVRVNLAEQDRFLTLIVTDSGTSYVEGQPPNHTDTCGFAEPTFSVTFP